MVLVRQVEKEDIIDITKIEHECFKDPYPVDCFLVYYAYCPQFFFVAEDKGRLVGYCLLDSSMQEIMSIAVLPGLRNKSIGSKLLEASLDAFRKNKIKLARVHVRASNKDAIEFWQFHGFSLKEKIKNYYGDEDGLLMEKEL
jgi:ribosomal-protein-alanine N-acetyltransferase